MRIGKSFGGSPGLGGMQIKEVRVWNEFRGDQLIREMRYQQLDPKALQSGQLSLYLKLINDNLEEETNLAHLNDDSIEKGVLVQNFTMVSPESSGEAGSAPPLLCPTGTFHHKDNACYNKPFSGI